METWTDTDSSSSAWRRQSCRNAVGGMLCTGLLCHGVGLMDRGKTFLHHIPVQVTFRRHGRHLCKGLLDFLFRREIPESGRSSSQYKYNRGGCGYAVKPRRKEKAASCLLRQPVTASHVATLPRSPPALSSLHRQDDCGTNRLFHHFLSYSVYSLILFINKHLARCNCEVDECSLMWRISAISLCDFSSKTYKLNTVRHPSGSSATNAISISSEIRPPVSAMPLHPECRAIVPLTTSWLKRCCFRR